MAPRYTAEVKSGLVLELPAEAAALHLKPGDRVQVQLVSISADGPKRRQRGVGTKGASETKRVLSGRGTFTGVLNSDEFMRRKQEDIARE